MDQSIAMRIARIIVRPQVREMLGSEETDALIEDIAAALVDAAGEGGDDYKSRSPRREHDI
jgi:hypothetical protein